MRPNDAVFASATRRRKGFMIINLARAPNSTLVINPFSIFHYSPKFKAIATCILNPAIGSLGLSAVTKSRRLFSLRGK
jgi:hypothetical protein